VSLCVPLGQTVGIAGESGCGKTTLTSSVLRLLPKSAQVTGHIRLDGEDVMAMSFGQLRAVRWAQAAVVFQGAMHALNPVQRIETQLAEPILLHEDVGPKAACTRVGELLEQVGLPASRARAHPSRLRAAADLVISATSFQATPRRCVPRSSFFPFFNRWSNR